MAIKCPINVKIPVTQMDKFLFGEILIYNISYTDQHFIISNARYTDGQKQKFNIYLVLILRNEKYKYTTHWRFCISALATATLRLVLIL